jgi:transcriptional regulator with XRE-family HTH domain
MVFDCIGAGDGIALMSDSSLDLQARVARRIAHIRRVAGATQEDLAGRLGIALKNLQRLESGKQNLTLQTIARVAVALEVEPEELLVDTPPRQVPGHLPLVAYDGGPPPRPVPVLHLEAAAGYVRQGRHADVVGWTLLRTDDERPFVAQVMGHSMEPLIPDGSWCLFRGGVVDVGVGRFLLMEHRGRDGSCSHSIKRITRTGQRLVLDSVNRAYPAISLDPGVEQEWRVLGEWLAVVAAPMR